jgi:fucose permease
VRRRSFIRCVFLCRIVFQLASVVRYSAVRGAASGSRLCVIPLEVDRLPLPEQRARFTASAVAYALFVPVGLITVMLGPLLPILSEHWSLNDTQGGNLVTAQFLGSLLGTVFSGPLVSRLAFRRTMVLGVVLMALGVATLVSRDYVWAAVSVFCYGAGIGITVPTTNLLVARTAGPERAASLNLLNFFWSAGAVICPFLLAFTLAHGGVAAFLFLLFGAFAVLTLAFLLVPIPRTDAELDPTTSRAAGHLRIALMVLFAALFFLYVGTESALGSWLATYAKRSGSQDSSGWMTVPAYFYGALLLGRLAAAWTLKRISALTQARLASLLATGGVAALLYSRTTPGIASTAAIVGLGLSTLYPIAIGLASVGLGTAAERIMGTLFAFSTLGGACVPWLVGFSSTHYGDLRTALLIPLAGCIAIAVLYWSPALKDGQSLS